MTKTKKAKITDDIDEQEDNSLPVVIPELRYLSEKYIVTIPASDGHFKDKWELRKYAAELLEKELGDEVQLTSMKIKKPHLLAKSKARLLKRELSARLLVTVKF